MKFRDAIRQLLSGKPEGLTPQELRDLIREHYPDLYGTESHRRNVEKGHYKDIDHAVLAQIYVVQNNATDILSDRSQKPMRLTLVGEGQYDDTNSDDPEETIATENLEKLERGVGTLYILGTNLYTRDGKEIVKIGITTGDVERRIDQLYNTSAPYRFRCISQFETKNYAGLEQAMHKLFEPFRINRSREYFTDECLKFIDALVEIHKTINGAVDA